MLDLRLVPELLEQRQQAAVDDDGLVAAVVRDVADVVGMQAQVERVQHEAAARDAEVRLEVLVVVPAQRRDAIAAREPQLLQRSGKGTRAPAEVRIRVAMEALVRQARNDLVAAEVRLGSPQDRR